jgi:ABC-type spermidine/putrescine transport system permease subunit II
VVRSLVRVAYGGVVGFVFLFVVAPIVIVLVTAFSATSFPTFPPTALSLRWLVTFARDVDSLEALRNSAVVALSATAVSVSLGTLAALGLDRMASRARAPLRAVFLSPLIFPKILLAIALVQLFYRLGLMASLTGLVLAHVVVTIPFVIQTVSASLGRVDRSLEDAARTLGAREPQVFFRITLPLVIYGVVAGAIFAFVISFNEIYVSLFVSGPRLRTLPVKIMADLEGDYSTLVPATGAIVLGIIFGLLFLFERVFRKDLSEYL